jgi:hypothetical protein
MAQFAQIISAAIGWDSTSMTAKRRPLYAPNADVISTSNKEMKKS